MADVPVYLVSRLAAEHVKVVLSGEGSDELLAGYAKHWGDLAVARFQRATPAALDAPVLRGASSLLGYRGRSLQVMLRAAAERDFLDRQAALFGLMSRAEARRLCPGLPWRAIGYTWPDDPGETDTDPLQRALLFDKTVWLPGTLLARGDRLTMAASIEGRMPFMDVQLCAFAARLPPAAFLAGRTGKQIPAPGRRRRPCPGRFWSGPRTASASRCTSGCAGGCGPSCTTCCWRRRPTSRLPRPGSCSPRWSPSTRPAGATARRSSGRCSRWRYSFLRGLRPGALRTKAA